MLRNYCQFPQTIIKQNKSKERKKFSIRICKRYALSKRSCLNSICLVIIYSLVFQENNKRNREQSLNGNITSRVSIKFGIFVMRYESSFTREVSLMI